MALFVHFVCLKSVENIHFYVFLRQETDSRGSIYPIKIILWIFGVIASIELLLKQTISSLFFVHWPKTHIPTMDDATPYTSQNNMGEPPTTLQPTTESPSVLMGPSNVDTTSSGMFNSPHFFDKFHYLSNKLSQLCYCIVV